MEAEHLMDNASTEHAASAEPTFIGEPAEQSPPAGPPPSTPPIRSPAVGVLQQVMMEEERTEEGMARTQSYEILKLA